MPLVSVTLDDVEVDVVFVDVEADISSRLFCVGPTARRNGIG